MKRTAMFLGVTALALLAAPARADDDKKDDTKKPAISEKLSKHLGDKTLEILNGATRVEVFRIAPRPDKDAKEKINDYPITATGKEQGKEFAADLAAVLRNDRAYFGTTKRCFLPGVAFRLWKDKESVEVIICFTCENLRVIAKDAAGKVIKQTNGAFGPEMPELVKVTKKAFPDDKEIQGLKEKKEVKKEDKKEEKKDDKKEEKKN